MQPLCAPPRGPAARAPRLPAQAALCVMALLAMFLTAAPAWSAPTAGAPLVSSASGRCLDVKGNVDTSGTGLQIWDCNGQANQAFAFTAAGELRTMNGTRCVDAYDTRTAPGAAVVIRPCDARATQMWRQNSDGSVTAAASGFCLDVSGAGTADGTAVIVWTCNGGSNQKWTAPAPPASGSRPCDIYAAGATPCVAAHSTVRALYGSYNGPLYQVRRASDNATRDIGVLASGGFADAAAQDSFCAGTTCVITVVYDQSGHGNDLWYQGSAQVPGSSSEQSREGDLRVADRRGHQGVLAVHQPRQQLLAGRPPDGRADRCRTRRGVHGDQRHPCQRRLLLRLRQQRDDAEGRRGRGDGRDQLRHRVLVRRLLRQRSLGAGRSRMGPVLRRQPVLEPGPARVSRTSSSPRC